MDIKKSFKEYIAAFGKWGYGVAAILVGDVFGIVQSYFNNLVMPQWAWWLILALILALSPLIAFHKIRVDRDEAQKRLDDIKNARPNIEVETQVAPEQLSEWATGKVVGFPLFAKIQVVNKPTNDLQRSDAPDVARHIEIQGQDGQRIFHKMIGRWAYTKHQKQGALPNEVEQMTLHPNGVPEPLLLALKYTDEELAYGLNVDNEKLAGWRDPNKRIPVGKWRVAVCLQGINVHKTVWLTLTNKGKGQDIELAPEVTQSTPDKEGFQI